MTDKEFNNLSIEEKWKLYLNNDLPFANLREYCQENYISIQTIKKALG